MDYIDIIKKGKIYLDKLKKLLIKFWAYRYFKIIITGLSIPVVLYLLLLISSVIFPVSKKKLSKEYKESYRIYDRNNTFLREIVNEDGKRARWVDYNDISKHVINATISVEDKRFYFHYGFDIISITRAVFQNIKNKKIVSGASTITMQLVRLIGGQEHNFTGKIYQLYNAFRIEVTFSKKEIMTHYLNRAPYGAEVVGIESASRKFFNKPNQHLSIAEAAFLAGLPKSPTDYNPFINFEKARKRQHHVLYRMYKNRKITKDEYKRSLKENILIYNKPPVLSAMHFTDYIITLNPAAGDITTTLDNGLNMVIEKLIKDHVKSLSYGGLTNAAAIVLDNTDGSILAMVGSSDYTEEETGSVNGATSLRQPGSALKPFTYALAFEKGFSPASVIADIETEYIGKDDRLFIPQNYSGKYHGPVLIKDALARSLNIPAIRVANAVGIENLLNKYREVGFISLDNDAEYYGLGLTLGNGEVTLIELAQSYALFARKGLTCRATPFFENYEYQPVQAFSKETCFLITEILCNENLRIEAFGISNPLLLGFPIAIKTGTSSNWRDNWVIGYTDKYTIAVWGGDFSGNPMNQISGSIGVGPLFNKIAQLVITRGANPEMPEYPVPPDNIESVIVCKLSGKYPGKHCDNVTSVYMRSEDLPLTECDVHRLLRIDKRNGCIASEKCPEKYIREKVFIFLPSIYAEWQVSEGITLPPTEYSSYAPLKGKAKNALVITKPRNGEVYIIEPGYDLETQTLEFNGEVDPLLPEITWILNGKTIANVKWPYILNWQLKRGKYKLQMSGSKMESDIVEFEVR